MSKHLTELCEVLVHENYDGSYSLVYRLLSRGGRQSLIQLCQRSALPVKTVKKSLVELIQHHLILHYTDNSHRTFYEANWFGAYTQIRTSKIQRYALGRYGNEAGAITSSLLKKGHATVQELIAIVNDKRSNGQSKGVVDESLTDVLKQFLESEGSSNGVEDSSVLSQNYKTVLLSMFLDGFVSKVGLSYFRPPTDNRNDAENIVRRMAYPHGLKAGLKEKAEFERKIKKMLQQWKSGHDEDLTNERSTPKPNKRALEIEEEETPVKKSRSNDHMVVNGDSQGFHPSAVRQHHEPAQERLLPSLLPIHIDQTRYLVSSRSKMLIKEAEARIGQPTSQVYEQFLNLITQNFPGSTRNSQEYERDEANDVDYKVWLSTAEVASSLSHGIDVQHLSQAAADVSSTIEQQSVSPKQRKKRKVEGDSQPLNIRNDTQASFNGNGNIVHNTGQSDTAKGVKIEMNHGAGPNDISEPKINGQSKSSKAKEEAVKMHLQLLADDTFRFIKLFGHQDDEKWAIDFSALVTRLRQQELENIVCQKFGDMALRIIRYLWQKGKSEEKQLQAGILLPIKQVRATLALLHSAGFIELQEIPRDSSRQISRNIYLWFFDAERCSRVVLDGLYQTMARCLQRRWHEKGQIRSLIKKAMRPDVRGQEDLYLTKMEQDILAQWHRKERKILHQVEDLDDLVAIFRDF